MDGAFQPPLHLLARTRTAAPVTVVPEPARHYARVMVEPGMAKAGKPLSNRQRAALDALDEVLADDTLAFAHRLQRGEMLVIDNVAAVHGRTAFTDGATPTEKRLLQRVWMWRRHDAVGDDPVTLDAVDFG